MITGIANENIIRIIIPAKAWIAVLEDLNQLDEHLKCGLRNFLCADDIEVKEDSKTISFEKTPNE